MKFNRPGKRRRLRLFVFALLSLLVLDRILSISYQMRIRYPKVRETLSERSFFIAANLHNNEAILPHWIRQLDRFIGLVGKDNVFVSIYESGSKDTTPELLHQWSASLSLKGINHKIKTDFETPKLANASRMTKLARYRNNALAPFFESRRQEGGHQYDRIIFLNDVFFEQADLINLAMGSVTRDLDVLCPLDYYYRFYDTLVMRDELGRPLSYLDFPLFGEGSRAQQLFVNNQKFVPVFSCWNGIVIFKASLFYQSEAKFRALHPKRNEASECCIIFSDLRNATKSSSSSGASLSSFIDPEIRIAYDSYYYWYQVLIGTFLDRFVFRPMYKVSSSLFAPALLTFKRKNRERFIEEYRRDGINVTALEANCL